mgnify:CR=1 FL=1
MRRCATTSARPATTVSSRSVAATGGRVRFIFIACGAIRTGLAWLAGLRQAPHAELLVLVR